jgi:nicotinamide-nucleotide amidase
MKAEIISIGTELLLGETIDTNSNYLAGQLPSLGIDLYWISQVGDNQHRLVEVLKRAWQRSEMLLTTGGLGPTEDDLTRESIAEMLGETMSVSPVLKKEIEEFFSQRGLEMPLSNLKQAMLVPSASAIHNIRGTAPGWWVEKDGHILIAMPGPPREMQHMWELEVQPKLRQRCASTVILSRTVKTFGLTEAAVDEMVTPLLCGTNPTLAIYAKADGIYLRLTTKAQSQIDAEETLARGEASVRSILGKYIWGTDHDTIEGIVGQLLAEKGLSLAVVESGTGGLLAATITDVPGSSSYFKGGIVAYSNEAKIACGVTPSLISDCGAISPEVAGTMAQAVRLYLKTDIGISTTGVAGLDEVENRTAGTLYIALDDGHTSWVIQGNYPGNRPQVKRRATTAALFELKKLLTAVNDNRKT